MNCNSCGVWVSSKGYLGGGIVCNECAEMQRKDDQEGLEERREKYGNPQ